MGDFSHLKNKKGELIHNPLPQPTLPNIKLDDDDLDDSSTTRTRVPPSTYTAQTDYYYNSDYKNNYPDYPPHQQQQSYAYNQHGYSENDSSVNLAMAAAPFAGQNDSASVASHQNHQGNYAYNNDYVVESNDTYYATGGAYPTQYGQGHNYSQGQQGGYAHDQYAQGGYGQGGYGQGQYTQDGNARQYDADTATLRSGLAYDDSEYGISPPTHQPSTHAQRSGQYEQSAYQQTNLHRGPSANAGTGGRARYG
jgi:hypothetical protein